jgi:hypothetical protein
VAASLRALAATRNASLPRYPHDGAIVVVALLTIAVGGLVLGLGLQCER